MTLDEDLASAFARVALANVSRPFPHRLDHLLVGGPEPDGSDHVKRHPAFFGSYDWHSSVHMHWLLVRVLRLHPRLPEATAITALLDTRLAEAPLAAERAYLASPAGATFERPYGWAWLLELRAELERLRCDVPRAAAWADAVDPLAHDLAARLGAFISTAAYPVRAGTHGSTAFAAILALDYADSCGDVPLAAVVRGAAVRWHGSDRDAPVAFEPSLTDFLSPTLAAAVLVSLALPTAEFTAWLDAYLPRGLGPIARPPHVSDRTDPQIAHLDGLSLSRAWMLRRLALRLPAGHRLVASAVEAAAVHMEAALPRTVGGDYAGEHWLASFAALVLGDVP